MLYESTGRWEPSTVKNEAPCPVLEALNAVQVGHKKYKSD